jgi:RimJ/RimL family protein N-acetyltransferase
MVSKNLQTLSQTTLDLLHPRDVVQVAALFRYVVSQLPDYNEAAKQSALSTYHTPTLQGMISSGKAVVLTAKYNDQCIGFCISQQDRGIMWLAWYGVHPHWRRQGVGGALLDTLGLRVREQGMHKIWTNCRPTSQAARRTLGRAGFEEICLLSNHWYGQDYLLLQKYL